MKVDLQKEIRKIIKKYGQWYNTTNYKVYTAKELIDDIGKCFDHISRDIILNSVSKIQRQCDGYAIELTENYK